MSASAISYQEGPASIDTADTVEEMGGEAFEQLVAHSKLQLAVDRGDKKMAKNALKEVQEFRANSQLRKGEWERMDDTLTRVATGNVIALRDLRSRGVDIPLDLGVTRYGWEDVGEFTAANVDMAATTGGDEDALQFNESGIPLPLVHKGFKINLRKLRSSRKKGQPLDTAGVAAATKQVTKKLEEIIFTGANITAHGDTIEGFTNFSKRQSVAANATWDGSTADNMIDDVMRLVEALEDANQVPGQDGFLCYVAKDNLQEIRAKSAGTDDKKGVLEHIKDRLGSEDEFPDVTFKRADYLPEGNATLVKVSPETINLPTPADIQVVEWDEQGGMVKKVKVMGSAIPALRADANGQSGVAHLAGI